MTRKLKTFFSRVSALSHRTYQILEIKHAPIRLIKLENVMALGCERGDLEEWKSFKWTQAKIAKVWGDWIAKIKIYWQLDVFFGIFRNYQGSGIT